MVIQKRGMVDKKGQIWVETVIYILITFVMISLVLSFVRPKIEELRDKAIIEQAINTMNGLDNIFSEVVVPGNKRVVDVVVRKGEMVFDAENDSITFEIESVYVYSEPGESIQVGELNVETVEQGSVNLITVSRDYSENYNLSYNHLESPRSLTSSSVPYKLIITNDGSQTNKTKINIGLV